MSASILNSTKKILGLDPDYTAFDEDIITHINTVFVTLNQLGIGPEDGFSIEDAVPTWDEFLDNNPLLNSIKTYVYLRVRLLFDPPATMYLLTSMKEQIQEIEWRINVQREGVSWVDPNPTPVDHRV